MAKPSRNTIRKWLIKADGIGAKLADKILANYGDETPQTVINDPKQVAADVRGVSLARAKDAAKQMRLMLKKEGASLAEVAPTNDSVGNQSVVLPTRANDARTAANRPIAFAGQDKSTGKPLTIEEVRVSMLNRWDEVFAKRKRAQEIFQRHQHELMNEPNVCGAHVGFRRYQVDADNSMISDELEVCIRVHVQQKLDRTAPHFSDPRLARMLPREIEGVGVDVLERSYTTLESSSSSPPVAVARTAPKDEPTIIGGIEIANSKAIGSGGTLGGIVYSGFEQRFITNRHVVGGYTGDANNRQVHQPDAATRPDGSSAVIGEVQASAIPSVSGQNSIDCAIIKPLPMTRPIQRTIKNIGPPDVYYQAKLTWPDEHRTRAFKIGAVTGRTSGIVQSVNAAVDINGVTMFNQILVESDSPGSILEPGDSGSLLLTLADDGSTFYVVGLVHAKARESNALVATHMDEIESYFGVKVSLFQ